MGVLRPFPPIGQAAVFGDKKGFEKSDPDRARTCDLLIRSQLLYPTELRDLRASREGEKTGPANAPQM